MFFFVIIYFEFLRIPRYMCWLGKSALDPECEPVARHRINPVVDEMASVLAVPLTDVIRWWSSAANRATVSAVEHTRVIKRMTRISGVGGDSCTEMN